MNVTGNRKQVKWLAGMALILFLTSARPLKAVTHFQTVPTRTPTPDTPTTEPPTTEPDDTPTPGGGGGSNPQPTVQVTTEIPPGTTATPSSQTGPNQAATPLGGYLPTTEPCGLPPVVQSRSLVNVRSGPGLEHEVIGTLVYLEVREIIGRSDVVPWWLIELADGTVGWVADLAVSVSGYTGLVPVVEFDEDGSTPPTPASSWNPTPNSICTPLPTYTPTSTPDLASPTVVAVLPTDQPSATRTSTPEPTATSTALPTNTMSPVISGADNAATPSLASLAEEPATSGFNPGWILLAGIGLVAVGGVTLLIRRAQGTGEDIESL